jgi:TetR/AcrR family transcriptional regulator
MDTPEADVRNEVAPAEQDERTRARLLRAAVKVFDRKGYASASVREIVELAGVTKPALYYHFGSKEGTLVAILQEAAHELDRAVARALARPGTARERLTALCEDLHALYQEHVPVVRVAHAVFLGPSEGLPAFDCGVFDRSLQGALARIVQDGQASGEVRAADPADVALAVSGVLLSSAERQLHPAIPPVGLDGLRRVLALVFDGVLQPQEQGVPRS